MVDGDYCSHFSDGCFGYEKEDITLGEKDLMIIEEKLSNGIRLVMEELPYVESLAMGIWVKAGSVDESHDRMGISHLIEHMLFKGTKKRSARDIAEEMDILGGQMNAFTGKEATCYYTKVLDSNMEKAADILSDMFTSSVFDKEELKKEKNVIFEEIKMIEDSPEDFGNDLLTEAVFKGGPLETPIIGTKEVLKKVSREDILQYLDERYTADNIVVSISGNYDEKEIKAVFEEKLNLKAHGMRRPLAGKASYEKSHILKVKDVEQSHIFLGLRGVPREGELHYPLVILNNILGGSMSSRLFQNIREQKGLAYSVFSSNGSFKEDGIFSIYAGTGHDKIEVVIDAIKEELTLLLSGGVTKEELIKAKEQLKTSIVFGQENVSSRMYSNGRNALLMDKILSTKEILDKIDAVNEEDIVNAAGLISDIEEYSSVLISDREVDLSKFLKA